MGRPRQLRTPADNRRIYGLLAQLRKQGLSKEDGEALKARLCTEISGQPHSSQLSTGQAGRLLAKLGEYLVKPPPAEPEREDAPQGAARVTTEHQQAVLDALFHQAGFRERKARMDWCRRQCGRPWPQSQEDVTKLMVPLQEMVLRRYSARELWARAAALVDHEGLDAWQRGFIADLVRQYVEAADVEAVGSTHKIKKLVEAELSCGVKPA